MKNKIKISQVEFAKKVKIWTLLVALIVALIASAAILTIVDKTTTSTQLIKQLNYTISPLDELKLTMIRNQYDKNLNDYQSLKSRGESEALTSSVLNTLEELAQAESSIMRKYDQGFEHRFPLYINHRQTITFELPIIFGILLFAYFVSNLICFTFLMAKYRVI